MAFYSELITKVRNMLQGWKGNLLSFGRSAVLLTHVLEAMPIHLLSAVDPPSFVIEKLHKNFAQFYWSNTVGESNRQTKPTLWSSFVSNKYLKKNNPILVPWKRGSHVWRKLLQARDLIDHQILWQLKMGSALFWFDNWSGVGFLYFLTPPDFYCNEENNNVSDAVTQIRWHEVGLRNNLPQDLADFIINEVQPPSRGDELDKPWWMLETNGQFSLKPTWEYVRSKGEKKDVYRKIWVKGLPFKPKEETVPHIFLKCATAQSTWKYFCSAASIAIDGLHLHQVIMKWWTADVIPRIKHVYYVVPSIIVWELCKKRNGYRHRNKVTTSRVIYQASTIIQQLVRLRKLGIKNVPHGWFEILKILEDYTPKLQVTKYMQRLRKLMTLVYAKAKEINDTTNTVSEALALLGAARYCLAQHVYSFILETDSLLMKNILDRTWKPPWNIADVVEEIWDITDNAQVQVLHIMREGDQLADHLANYALDYGEIEVNSFAELDSKGKKILNSDNLHCPYLRIKTVRKY
ncbi:uncharacterized protein LOC132065727 [Lycium ferocissimum]|uniref:uncharacterized protein LOC132065727 n=1 Tax=Lycium ferocissimum TaxID=112874 RepID=UPI0028151B4D|nr:uncharacterized protein LOC132065727 [Lycium ferocissimum]